MHEEKIRQRLDKEKPTSIEVIQLENISILYSIIQGKGWGDFSPKKPLGEVMQVLLEKGKELGVTHFLGQIEFNRADKLSYTGGQWLVAQIGYTPKSEQEDSSEEPLKLLKDISYEPDTVSAKFIIQDSMITTLAGNFDAHAVEPLAHFVNLAIKKLGPDINVNAMLFQGLEVWCRASKRT